MRKEGTSFARSLRRRETDAERALWSRLRNRQIDGWKFKRQVPLGPYILDFFCFDARLVVEVDGATHAEAAERERDATRAAYINSAGHTIIRFWNGDVVENIDGVVECIYQALGQRPAPSPGASSRSDAPHRRRRPLPRGRGKPEQAENLSDA